MFCRQVIQRPRPHIAGLPHFSVIKYLEVYFFCRECSAVFCASCQIGHSYVHVNSIFRFIDVSWSPKMKDIRVQGECSRCSRVVKCRLECLNCLSSVCQQCLGPGRDEWLAQHRESSESHKSFRRLLPPYWIREPVTNQHCPCFDIHGVINHCDRCLKGVMPLFSANSLSLTMIQHS